MRIGFDLDGTLADMQSALVREARRLFPGIDPALVPVSTAAAPPEPGRSDAKTADAASIGGLTSSQHRELWKAVCARQNFWEELAEIEPGSIRRLYELTVQRRWEVIFLTSRPESAGDCAQAQSHRWLAKHGFETPSVFVVHGSRGKIASALGLDVFVDDRPENCLDISIDSQTRAILLWRDAEDKVPGSARQLGIGSVSTVADCLDILENLDRGDHEGEGLIGRFKRLLGITSRQPRRAPSAGGLRSSVAKPALSSDRR